MSNQTSVRKAEFVKNNLRIKVLLEKLRTKLKNFAVMDREGLLVGMVKDAKLDSDRCLNLVLSEPDSYQGSRFVLVRSNHIQRVDYATKSLFVDFSKAEVDQLPEFKLPVNQGTELSNRPVIGTAEVVDENAIPATNDSEAESIPTQPESTEAREEFENDGELESDETPEVVEEEVIRLLEERLVVDRTKRKVGEVIIRKEIETRMVEVPVHYEKLIVEQVSPERKQLAEIELGHEDIPGIELTEIAHQKTAVATQDTQPTVRGEFPSPKAASLLLDAIAMQPNHKCKKVRVEIVLEDAEHQETYQKWFDRCSGK